jgi:hypothetical protein
MVKAGMILERNCWAIHTQQNLVHQGQTRPTQYLVHQGQARQQLSDQLVSRSKQQKQSHWSYPTDCFIAVLSQNQTIPKQTGAK